MSPLILRRRRAITLIQVLVVLAILALLLAFLLPAVQRVRAAAGRTMGVNNMKQVIIAIHAHHDVYKRLPSAFDKDLGKFGFKFPVSLHVRLLPFVEQEPLYRLFHDAKDGDKVRDIHVPVFTDPLDVTWKMDGAGIQNYAANLRLFSISGNKSEWNKNMPELKDVEPGNLRLQTIPDGASQTLAFATKIGVCADGGSKYASPVNSKTAAFIGQNHAQEKASSSSPKATFQLAPVGKECLCSPLMAQSFDKKGILVAFADGVVRILDAGISPETWNVIMHPSEGKNPGPILGGD